MHRNHRDQVLRQKDLEKSFVLACISQSRGSAEPEVHDDAVTLSASRGLGQRSFTTRAKPRRSHGPPRLQAHCFTSVSGSFVEKLERACPASHSVFQKVPTSWSRRGNFINRNLPGKADASSVSYLRSTGSKCLSLRVGVDSCDSLWWGHG